MSNSPNASGESVAPISVLTAEPVGSALNVPDSVQLFDADFSRSGQDLILSQDGSVVLQISDFFSQPVPPDLTAENGALLRGDIAARLAGSDLYAMSAQTGVSDAVTAIGQVELISGEASVQRVDGTIEPLSVGSKIFQNDILSTTSNGTLSVTFADGTIFSLSPASRMVIDTLVYDQGGDSNAGSFNLLTGGFVFIAGQVAKTGDMEVNTPSATMGIRGTTVQVNMEVDNGITSVIVALNRDPDGSVGSAVLRDLDGELIAILTTTETQWIVSPIEGETREVERTALDFADDSVLIDEAIAAFTSANARVARGETYVDFGSGQSGGSGSPPVTDDTTPDLEQSPGSDIELGPGGEAPGGITPPGDNGGSGSSPGESGEDGGAGSFDESNIDNIRGIDSPPQANNVVIVGSEDPADDSQISGQASVQGGDPARLNYAIGTGPENGSASIEPNGVFTYVPDPNFNGTDSFTYIVTGPDGTSDSATVTVEVVPVNDAPVTTDRQLGLSEDTQIVGRIEATDADGDRLFFSVGTPAANGRVELTEGGRFIYTPDANFEGSDSFVYQVRDGNGAQETGTVTIQVDPADDVPQIDLSASSLNGSVGPSGAGAQIVSGKIIIFDPDVGESLNAVITPQAATGSLGAFSAGPVLATGTPGTYEVNWTFSIDALSYASLQAGDAPQQLYDLMFTDSTGLTEATTVAVTIEGINDAPVANDDSALGSEDGAISGTLLGNDSDIDGDTLSIVANTQPANGSVTVAANGSFTYTPDADFNGTDSFTYTVSDGEGGTDTATVTLQIAPVNDAPVANDDSASGSEDSTISGTLLGNDSDIDGDTLSVIANTQPANGSITVAANGSFTYTPDADFNGTDSFTYTVSDGEGGTDTATVTLQVAPVNDAPEARGDVASTEESETIIIDVLANDRDVDGDALTVLSAGDGTNGSVEVNPDGTVSYSPDEGFFGVDSFSYTMSDGTNERTASVTVVVRQDPADFPETLPATLTFNVDAENGNPAGYVAIEVVPVESNAVNVVFALDSSGSVTAQGWGTMLEAVEGAALRLAQDFSNSATELNVHIIAYSTDVASPPSESAPRTFTIASPDESSELEELSEYLSELPFQAGWTDWTEALQSAQGYFAAQDPSDANLMYFITDGDPIVFGVEQPASQWAPIAEALRADLGVDVTAFGIGPNIDLGNLQLLDPEFDSNTQILNATDDVTAAFDASPLFNAQLVDFSLILTRDGETVGEIADISVFDDISTGINFELPLANIDGLSGLLGTVNQFTISARFDLNGDPDSTNDQILIVTQATIARNDTAQDREGSEGNDLLLGSDLSDTIAGLGGDDLLLGFDGNDRLRGGAGDDLLSVSSLSAQALDGGAGRDVLTLLTGDNISTSELIALNISGIEALDFDNGQANLVTLTEADIFGLSDTGDIDLEALLGGAAGLGETATIYGDASDEVVLTGQAGVTAFSEDTSSGPVTDDDGNELAIYTLTSVGTSEILATLGIDTDVTVTPING